MMENTKTLKYGIAVLTTFAVTVAFIQSAFAWDYPSPPSSYLDYNDGTALSLKNSGIGDACNRRNDNKYEFCPSNVMTREQFYAMLARALQLDPSTDVTTLYDYALRYADNSGSFYSNQAEFIYNATSKQMNTAWLTGKEKTIDKVKIDTDRSFVVGNIFAVLADASGAYTFATIQIDSTNAKEWIDLPAQTYAVTIDDRSASIQQVHILYDDGSTEVIQVPRLSSGKVALVNAWVMDRFPWVVAAINAGVTVPPEKGCWQLGCSSDWSQKFFPQDPIDAIAAALSISKALGYDQSKVLQQLPSTFVNSFNEDWAPAGKSDIYLSYDMKQQLAVIRYLYSIIRWDPTWWYEWNSDKFRAESRALKRSEGAALIVAATAGRYVGDREYIVPNSGNPKGTITLQYRPIAKKLAVGDTIRFPIYRVPDNVRTAPTKYDELSVKVTAQDVARGYVEVTWTPNSNISEGVYHVGDSLGAYFFLVTYNDLLSVNVVPNPVSGGSVLTISADVTGTASYVTAEVPAWDGRTVTIMLERKGVVGSYNGRNVTRWEAQWPVSPKSKGGTYSLKGIAVFPNDVLTRSVSVTLGVVTEAGSLHEVCGFLSDPIWVEPGASTIAGCMENEGSAYTVKGGTVTVEGVGSMALQSDGVRLWYAQFTAPTKDGVYRVVYDLDLEDDSGNKSSIGGEQMLIVSEGAGSRYCPAPDGLQIDSASSGVADVKLIR